MSQVRDYEKFDEEYAQLIEDPELNAELEAAIDEADAHPEDNVELGEFLRRLRNGE